MIFGLVKGFLSNQTFFSVLFFLIASILTIVSFQNFEPILVSLTFLFFGIFLIFFKNLFFNGKNIDFSYFFFLFSVMYTAVGIGAFFYSFLGDKINLVDALYFYKMSVGNDFIGDTPAEIRNFTEGSLVLFIWIQIYSFFESFFFEKEIYIGLLSNAFCIALSGIVAISSSRILYGYDSFKEALLIFLISFNGVFLLFSGVYLRDAYIILCLSIIYYSWIRYLTAPGILNLIYLVTINFSFTFILPYLRFEYGLIPVSLTILALVLILFFKNTDEKKNPKRAYIAFFLFILSIVGYLNYSEIFLNLFALNDGVNYVSAADLLTSGREGYQEGTKGEASADSFGLFLTTLPIYFQVILMPLYMIFFPMPFWGGFESGSAYGFFKSVNVLQMYIFIPLLVLSTWQLIKRKVKTNLAVIFNHLVFYIFLMAVALTSGEGRHLGGFWIPAYLAALSLDFNNLEIKSSYTSIFNVLMFLIIGAHLLWIILKIIILFV